MEAAKKTEKTKRSNGGCNPNSHPIVNNHGPPSPGPGFGGPSSGGSGLGGGLAQAQVIQISGQHS